MIPQNEQGVVALFSDFANEMGYRFVEIGTRCPDAILEKDGRRIRVEFEFHAMNFKRHRHNPEDVDLVICWDDDYEKCPVPVLSMEQYITLSGNIAQSRLDKIIERIKYFIKRINEMILYNFNESSSRKAKIRKQKAVQYCEACGHEMRISGFSENIYSEMHMFNYCLVFFVCDNCGLKITRKVTTSD